MSFLDELKKTTNLTHTENGAVTNLSTLDAVLDFFSLAAAMRDNIPGAVKLFKKAYAQDALLALRALFYMRDVRGGQGERELFRACLKEVPADVLAKNLPYIPEYGRWDDLFALDVADIIPLLVKQIKEDEANMLMGNKVSLLAKWMPSENTSSEKTRTLATKIRSAMGLSPRNYRIGLSQLRTHIKLLEQQMSAKQWGEINYETTPSQAMRKHVRAFKRNDETRYSAFLDDVVKGEKKMKTSTLYTYEVFETVRTDEQAANAMWKSLPDYTNGQNALVLADVSGSMMGRPMSISVSLALYYAERNSGPFKNCFLTFAETPRLTQVLGETLSEKLSFIENREWGGNTNIEAAFKAILAAAIKSQATPDEMPKVLYIISDMEFDSCVEGGEKTNFEVAKEMFETVGYKLPHVVFWNVDARNEQVPATKYDECVTLISGSSQSTFRYVVEGKTPLQSMNDILNSERYQKITI